MIWYLSPTFASWLSKFSDKGEDAGLSSNELHSVVFSAIGLFVVVNAIPDIVYGVGYYYGIVSSTRADKEIAYVSAAAYLGSLAIKCLLGIWLLVGSHGVIKIIRTMQHE